MKMKLLPIFITTLLLGCDGGSSSTVQEPSDKIINTLLPVMLRLLMRGTGIGHNLMLLGSGSY